jgi:exosortase/archaeosortase family protein
MKINPKALLQEQYLIPVKIVAMYLAWKVFHHFASIPDTALNHHWLDFVIWLGSIYAAVCSYILSALGMSAVSEGININLLTSGKQVWVQDHCLAIPAMVIFTGSVIFFKGSFKDKSIFLAIGLIGITLINIIRILLVAVAWVYMTPYFFRINHSMIYVAVMYGFIFYIITRWMNRIMKKQAI